MSEQGTGGLCCSPCWPGRGSHHTLVPAQTAPLETGGRSKAHGLLSALSRVSSLPARRPRDRGATGGLEVWGKSSAAHLQQPE